MRITHGKLDNIVKELKHTRDLARTSLPPMAMNMTIAGWNAHRVEKLAYEIGELVIDLENNIETLKKLDDSDKYYRTVYILEILSDQTILDLPLSVVVHEITHGDFSGNYEVSEMRVTKKMMREMLVAQGSDPEFLLGDEEE